MELSEDEMVDWLSHLQKLARELFKAATAKPYIAYDHEKACTILLNKMEWLAEQGDVV